jgi:hypothetical protein
MTQTEALRLALEALELAHPRFGIATEKHKQAITAIKAALKAKDEKQEPNKFDLMNESFEREEANQAQVREFMRNH